MKAYGIGLALVLASVGGKCDDHGETSSTLATIEPVRGRTTLDEEPVVRFGRATATSRIETERDALATGLRLPATGVGRGVLLAGFLACVAAYGVAVESLDPDRHLAWAATMVVSLMHFWYDGFVWSVRSGDV